MALSARVHLSSSEPRFSYAVSISLISWAWTPLSARRPDGPAAHAGVGEPKSIDGDRLLPLVEGPPYMPD